MMGIPIDGATHVYEDSMSLMNNTSKLDSIIQKKNNAIFCCTVQEFVAMGKSFTAHIDGRWE